MKEMIKRLLKENSKEYLFNVCKRLMDKGGNLLIERSSSASVKTLFKNFCSFTDHKWFYSPITGKPLSSLTDKEREEINKVEPIFKSHLLNNVDIDKWFYHEYSVKEFCELINGVKWIYELKPGDHVIVCNGDWENLPSYNEDVYRTGTGALDLMKNLRMTTTKLNTSSLKRLHFVFLESEKLITYCNENKIIGKIDDLIRI
jgi:hypothetical protein